VRDDPQLRLFSFLLVVGAHHAASLSDKQLRMEAVEFFSRAGMNATPGSTAAAQRRAFTFAGAAGCHRDHRHIGRAALPPDLPLAKRPAARLHQ